MKDLKKTRNESRTKNKKKGRHENGKWQILMPNDIRDYDEYVYGENSLENILKSLGKERFFS